VKPENAIVCWSVSRKYHAQCQLLKTRNMRQAENFLPALIKNCFVTFRGAKNSDVDKFLRIPPKS
jgi:hypothetical protein